MSIVDQGSDMVVSSAGGLVLDMLRLSNLLSTNACDVHV